MEKYTSEDLESFVTAIRNASLAIAKINPAHYIISLHGSLPLFDILAMTDRDVKSDKAVYFPGASKIKDSSEVLTRCFENFFLEKQDERDDVRPLASIDEVVSGGSIARVLNAYHSASRKVARINLGNSQKLREDVEKASKQLREQFPLVIYGIREMRQEGTKMNSEYLERIGRGEVLEFPTKKIITMDDLDYQTVEFDHPNSSGFAGQCYFPKIKKIVISAEYRDLISDVAKFIGIDPNTVELARARVSSDCDKYAKKIGKK